jgi:hypothetical protein
LRKFRIVDLRSDVIEPEQIVEARSPEDAAWQALGEKAVRGGQSLKRLVCRAYWQDSGGQTNMVRLYRPLPEDAAPSPSRSVFPGT